MTYYTSSKYYGRTRMHDNRELKHAAFLSHGRQPEVCCFLRWPTAATAAHCKTNTFLIKTLLSLCNCSCFPYKYKPVAQKLTSSVEISLLRGNQPPLWKLASSVEISLLRRNQFPTQKSASSIESSFLHRNEPPPQKSASFVEKSVLRRNEPPPWK